MNWETKLWPTDPPCNLPLRSLTRPISEDKANVIETTAEIVSSFAANNNLAANELPSLIRAVHEALAGVSVNGAIEPEKPKPAPAVPIKKSVTPDEIICLEDGRKFKSLKRHLRTKYDLTPEQYRTKWGLPKDYPMVAPAYAEAPSGLVNAGVFQFNYVPTSGEAGGGVMSLGSDASIPNVSGTSTVGGATSALTWTAKRRS